ncbi:MAG: hypothetical protein ACREXT_17395, partial [Gammaproteobacteria bacterium]
MELDETALIDVRGKQLDRVLQHSRTEVLGGLAGVVLAVLATNGTAPASTTLSWAAVTAACYAGRFALGEHHRRKPATDATVKLRTQAFLATVIATGLCWGLLLAYMLHHQGIAAATPV